MLTIHYKCFCLFTSLIIYGPKDGVDLTLVTFENYVFNFWMKELCSVWLIFSPLLQVDFSQIFEKQATTTCHYQKIKSFITSKQLVKLEHLNLSFCHMHLRHYIVVPDH
jgi:hypothetical protein